MSGNQPRKQKPPRPDRAFLLELLTRYLPLLPKRLLGEWAICRARGDGDLPGAWLPVEEDAPAGETEDRVERPDGKQIDEVVDELVEPLLRKGQLAKITIALPLPYGGNPVTLTPEGPSDPEWYLPWPTHRLQCLEAWLRTMWQALARKVARDGERLLYEKFHELCPSKQHRTVCYALAEHADHFPRCDVEQRGDDEVVVFTVPHAGPPWFVPGWDAPLAGLEPAADVDPRSFDPDSDALAGWVEPEGERWYEPKVPGGSFWVRPGPARFIRRDGEVIDDPPGARRAMLALTDRAASFLAVAADRARWCLRVALRAGAGQDELCAREWARTRWFPPAESPPGHPPFYFATGGRIWSVGPRTAAQLREFQHRMLALGEQFGVC